MCYECFPESNSNPRLPNKPEQIPPPLSSSSFEDWRGPVCRAGFTTPCTHLSRRSLGERYPLLKWKRESREVSGQIDKHRFLFVDISEWFIQNGIKLNEQWKQEGFKRVQLVLGLSRCWEEDNFAQFSCVTLKQQTFLLTFARPCQILQP